MHPAYCGDVTRVAHAIHSSPDPMLDLQSFVAALQRIVAAVFTGAVRATPVVLPLPSCWTRSDAW